LSNFRFFVKPLLTGFPTPQGEFTKAGKGQKDLKI